MYMSTRQMEPTDDLGRFDRSTGDLLLSAALKIQRDIPRQRPAKLLQLSASLVPQQVELRPVPVGTFAEFK